MSDSVASTNQVTLDDEGRRLQLEAEKAKLHQAIAQSQQQVSSLQAAQLALPAPSGAATGTTSVGEKAGAYGSALAMETLTAAAVEMATAVWACLDEQVKPPLVTTSAIVHQPPVADADPGGDMSGWLRVVVIDDRSLLSGAMAGQRCHAALAGQKEHLASLADQLERASSALALAVKTFDTDPGLEDQSTVEGWGEGAGEGGGDDGHADQGGAVGVGARGVVGTAMTSATNLLSLAAVDHTLASLPVTTSSAHLVTATAAALLEKALAQGRQGGREARGAARLNLGVEVDGFSLARLSPTLDEYEQFRQKLHASRTAAAKLLAELRPVEAQLSSLRLRLTQLEVAWSTWAGANERSADGGNLLRTEHDTLTRLAEQRQLAVAPATAICDRASVMLAEAEADLRWMLAGEGSQLPPLVSAVRWERTFASTATPAHVLFVENRALTADSLTRKSVLGTSSRLTFLATAATSWLLLDPSTGLVVGGSDHIVRRQLRLDLDTGALDGPNEPAGKAFDTDPLQRVESVVRWVVVLTALALIFFAVCGGIALITG